MKQLTIRGFDDTLERRIRDLARSEKISLNQAVLRLLRKGAGLEDDPGDQIGSSLDDLIGTWTEEEGRAFDKAVSDFEVIDEEMWR